MTARAQLSLLAIFTLSPAVVHAQQPATIDAVVASPSQFKVLLENEHARVLQYTLHPGERDSVHTHPPKISYVLSGGSLRVHLPGGITILSDEKAGHVAWSGAVPPHHVENIGTTPVSILLVEVKAAVERTAATPPDTMPASVVQRFVDAANARDVKAMAALVAPGAVFARFPDGRVMLQGRDSIAAHYSRSLTSAPAAFRITVAPRIVEGRIVIDQEHFAGLPGSRTQATWMYEVQGGRIHRAWVVEGR